MMAPVGGEKWYRS